MITHPNALINCCIQVYIAAKALIGTINCYTEPPSENSRPVRLLIYIDESHEMTTSAQTIKHDGRTVYEVLCSSLNQLLDLNLFFVFISTNYKLSDYSPPSRVHWSTRVQKSVVADLQTPYTELPFDIWKEPHSVSEDAYKMNDVCSFEFIVRFGRPL